MNSTAKKTSTVGEIVNLMMVDTERILSLDLHFLWSIPMTLTVGVYFVWQELGAATLAGIAVLLLLVPLNTWLSIQIHIEQVGFVAYSIFLQKSFFLNRFLVVVKQLPEPFTEDIGDSHG